MLIRQAVYEDLPSILDIMNEAILNTTAIYDYTTRTMDFIEEWFIAKQKGSMPVLVCEVDNNVAGYSSYSIFRAWDAYKFSVEHSVYVHNAFQGQGIGRHLVIALISQAKENGYHTMIAGIDAANQPSYNFHKKLGFVEAGRFKEVGYKFDKWLDLIFMQLMLT